MKHLLIYIFLHSTALAAADCPPVQRCEELDSLSYACSESFQATDCDKFVDSFDSFLSANSCSIHTCANRKGAAYVDVHFNLLGKLASVKALKLYTSEKFRKSLDGHLGEVHRKRSLKDQNKLGKSLKPLDYDSACDSWENVKFSTSTSGVSTGKIDTYEVTVGDTKPKVTNLATNKSCLIQGLGITLASDQAIKKVKSQPILWFETYSGSKTWTTLVDMNSCEKIWEIDSSKKLSVTKVGKSPWKECQKCWNDQFQGCLRH